MSETTTSEPHPVQDRQDIIETAIRFLNNPKVIPTPLESKRLFLSKKGLTESEINAALQKSASTVKVIEPIPVEPKVQVATPSLLQKIFRWVKNIILTGCIAYAGYKLLLKKFLNKKSKLDVLKSSNDELKKSLNDIKSSINSLKDSIELINNSFTKISVQKSSDDLLKGELQSIKSLLLNRQQFPSIPTVNPIIPTWQLETKSSSIKTSPNDSVESKSDENSE